MGSKSPRKSTTALKAARAFIDEIDKEEVLDVAPLAYATPLKSLIGTLLAKSPKGAPMVSPDILGHRPALGKHPLNSPPPRQHPPWLDFYGK